MPTAIAEQLKRRGIDAVTVNDLGLKGDEDVNHLQRATNMGRVLCTMDEDFLTLAASGIQHAGIIYGKQNVHSIGEWVTYLEALCYIYNPADMQNQVEYI